MKHSYRLIKRDQGKLQQTIEINHSSHIKHTSGRPLGPYLQQQG